MTTVVLVEDVALFREALAEQLRGVDWEVVVGTTADMPDAAVVADRSSAEVVLVSLASVGGIQALRMIRRSRPDARLIAIAVTGQSGEAVTCARLGVAGIVLRDGTLHDLVAAVAGVVHGETVCPPSVVAELMRHLADQAVEGPEPAGGSRLTPREREVLVFIEEGLTNKEISRRLGIEERTVKNHVHHVLEKLRVHHRSEAAGRLRATRVPELEVLVEMARPAV